MHVPALWEKIGALAAFILPLWNIPLMVRVLKRKSSEDISLVWAVGVWTCCALMAPAGFVSEDLAYRLLNIMTMIFFTIAFACILYYRKPRRSQSASAEVKP